MTAYLFIEDRKKSNVLSEIDKLQEIHERQQSLNQFCDQYRLITMFDYD